MGSRFRRVSLVLIAVVGIGALVRVTLLRAEPVPVTVFRVARGAVEETVTNSKAGTVRARRRAMLSPEIGGRVAQLAVREGQQVARGDVLMRLADGDLRAQVELRERGLHAARAGRSEACLAAEQAAREHARQVALAAQNIVSEEQIERLASERDVAAAACVAAEARVEEAQAAVDLAGVDLSKAVLHAPFDAVVAEVSTEVGEWITPSPPGVPLPAVIELIERSALYVSAPLDEVDVARVQVGLPVRVTLDAYPDRRFAGRLTRIAPYVLDLEEHSRTFEVEVELDDPEFARSLLPGSSADVELILDSKDGVLRIPSYALIEGGRVLVFDGGRLVARAVSTGLENWAFTEVTAGLSEGEAVVVSLDRAEVTEGARARVAAETLK